MLGQLERLNRSDDCCTALVRTATGKELADLAEGLADAGHSPSIVLLHSINDRLRSLVASPAGAEKQEAPADGGRTPSAAGTTAAEPSRTGGGIGGDVQQRVLAALDKLGFKESAKVPNPPEQQQTARSKEADYV